MVFLPLLFAVKVVWSTDDLAELPDLLITLGVVFLAFCAVSAVDIALWDLKARFFDVPLYQLLGGQVRDRVVCYPHVDGETTEELVADALQKVAEGWKFVRFNFSSDGEILDPRAAVRNGIAEFAAVREAVGPEIEMIVEVKD